MNTTAAPSAASRPLAPPASAPPRLLLTFRRHVESFGHLPYVFASQGFCVETIVTRYTAHLRSSRHVHACHEADYEAAPFARRVGEIVAAGDYALVLLVDEPSVVAVFAEAPHPALAKHLPFPLDSGIGATVGRKDLFQAFAEHHHIPTPRTVVAHGRDQAARAAATFALPCVLKGSSGSSGNTVHIVRTPEEREAHIARLETGETLLIQEHIEGVTAAATFLAWRGQLKCWIATTKHLALSRGKGPTVAADFLTDPEIGRICAAIARAGPIHGITGFDFMRDAHGGIHVIDPHFGRLTTLCHFGPYCGIDFGQALRECLAGDTATRHPLPSPIRAVKFPEVLVYLAQGGLLRTLREARPFRRHVRYFVAQPGDWRLAARLGLLTLGSITRCHLGALKSALLGLFGQGGT